MLLRVKYVEFRLKPYKTWSIKEQKFVKQTEALFDISSNSLQQSSWLCYAMSFTAGAGSITVVFVLLETYYFLRMSLWKD